MGEQVRTTLSNLWPRGTRWEGVGPTLWEGAWSVGFWRFRGLELSDVLKVMGALSRVGLG